MKHESFFESLGESAVRLKVASLPPDNDVAIEGAAWLEDKRAAREAETLSIAKDANRIASEHLSAARDSAKSASDSAASAKEQARWALWAAIIATVAAIIATKDAIILSIFG